MRIIIVLLACLPWVSSFAADPFGEALTNCVVADGSDGSTLAVVHSSLWDEPYFVFYTKDASGEWKRGPDYRGILRALVKQKQKLWAFGPGVSDIYDLEGKWVQSTPWIPAWQPLAAAVVDGELFVFGAEPAPSDDAAGMMRAARFAENRWVNAPALALNRAPIATGQLCVVPARDGASAQVLWIAAGKDAGEILIHRETFTGTGWEYLPAVPAPASVVRLAAARDDDFVLLFLKDANYGITKKHPLLCAEVKAEDLSAARAGMLRVPLNPVANLRDERMTRTHMVAASSVDGKVSLYLLSNGGLDVAPVDVGAAGARANVFRVSVLKRVEGGLVVWLIMAAYLVVLGFSVWRTRNWPRRIEFQDTVLQLASWKQRVGAFLVDSMLLVGVFLLIAAASGVRLDLSDSFSLLAFRKYSIWLNLLGAIYFIMMESYRGQTIGKRLFGIAVVTYDLKPPKLIHVVIRNIVRLVEHVAVALIVVLNLRTSQRIGDLFAGTFVVKLPKKADNGDKADEHDTKIEL